jgi:hypothetical protein
MSSQLGKGSHIQGAVTEECHISNPHYKFYIFPLHTTSRVNLIIFNYLSLYEAEMWCVTLREEQRLGAFQNRVLREMYGLRGKR